MLELIFQGFAEWLYGMALECWEYFSSALLDIMSLDFAYLKTHIPIINDIMQVILAVGWALLLGNLVFQAAKSMLSGLGFEGEDPKLLFARTFVFAFLLLASPQICEIGLNITSTIMDLLQVPTAVNVHLVDDSVFGSLTAAWLLVIIFDLILMFKVLKLLLEIAERYVILAMLTITAPLAFATGGSRNTSDIFSGWCRMYGSMCVLMCTNVIFFKLLLSVVSAVPSGLDVFPWMVLILAIVKVAKKADAIITRIGLNPAITGDSLGSRLPGMLTYAVVRTVASNVTKAAKKSAGGTNRGRASGFSPSGGGGGPRSGGPFGGRGGPGMGATAGTTGQNGPQNSTTQQGTSYQQGTTQQGAAYQGGTQQGAAYQSSTQTGAQPGAAQPSGQQPPAKGQTGGTTFSSTTSQAGHMGGQSSRKSSVPPGTHRSPSHVTATESPVPGATTPGRPGAPSRGAAGGVHIVGGVTGSQDKPGTAGTPSKVGGPFKSTAIQPGMAGIPSKGSGPSKSGVAQSGTAGTPPKAGGPFKSTAAQPGMAGIPPKGSGPSKPGTVQSGTAGTSPKAVGAFKSTTAQPDMAGTPSKGAAPSKPGTAQPGTAGKSGPGATTRFTQVASQRVQGGDTTAKVQAAEQNAISVGQKQPSPGVGRPGSQSPGVPVEQKAQPGKTVTRFTQRESRESKIGQPPAASQAAKAAQTPPSVQSGTAGTGVVPAKEHSSQMTRHGRDVPSPAGSTTHITQTATSPARQEPGKASEVAAPSVKGSPVQPRPGTAGTAPTAQQAAQTRQTARGQTLRAKSTPMATDSLGGKKAASTASAVEKGRIAPKGPVTPKVQQPSRKRTDKPPRKGGGGERGK